ncbi:hypothetical protein ABE527_14235 [Brucella sp. TWI432]
MNDHLWDGKMVRLALVKAWTIEEAIGGSWKPRGGKGFWPEMVNEDPIWAQPSAQERRKTVWKAHEISQKDLVLYGNSAVDAWPRLLNGEPGYKRCLMLAVIWDVRKAYAKTACKRAGIAYSTFRRQRDNGADKIATILNQAGIAVW